MKYILYFTLLLIAPLCNGQEEEKSSKMGRKSSTFVMKEKGFFSETALGANYGNNANGYKTSGFVFNTTVGYQYRDFALGIGVGTESWFETFAFPVYSSFRYYFSRNKMAPYLALNGGYCFGQGKREGVYYDFAPYPYYPNTIGVNGPFGSIHFGIRRSIGENFALVLSSGARYQHSKEEYYSYYLNQNVTEISEYYRFEVRLGVYFN